MLAIVAALAKPLWSIDDAHVSAGILRQSGSYAWLFPEPFQTSGPTRTC
jgi:hypothetical protein